MKQMQDDILSQHNPHGWPKVVVSITGAVYLARSQADLDAFRLRDRIALAIGFALATAVLGYLLLTA